jgi:putative PEP-CTERM system TPR-repeat lipoprotein
MYINTKSKLAVQALLLTTILLGCGDNKTSNEYMAEARAAFNKGENSVAIISLKNVLKTEKNNLEARFLLGSVYAQQGLWVNAEKELRIASNAGFTDGNIDILLTKIHYRLEDSDYLTSVKNIQNEYSDLPKIYLAILAIKQGDVVAGRSIFDEITLAGSNQDLSNLAMAWDYFLNADYTASLKLLDTLAVAPVIKEDVIELRVVNLVAQKKHEVAAEQLEIFLALHPQSHIHRLQLAEQYVKYRNYEKAEKNADVLLSYYKNNVMLNRIKAEIKFNAKDYSSAKEFAEISLRNSDDVLSKVIAGMSAYQLGQYESSYNYLNAASRFFPEAHPVNQVLNSLSSQLQNSSVANDPLLPDVVLSLIKSGSYKQARTALEKNSESSQLNDGVIDFRLGLLKIIEGDSSFTGDFERAISNGFDGIEPKVLLAQQYLKDKKYSKVLEIAEALFPTQHTTALLLKGSVYLEKQELGAAIKVYEEILSNEPEHTGAMFKLSETFFNANDLEKSMEYLKKIYSLSSSNLYAVKHLFKFSLTPSNKTILEQFFISQAEKDKKDINRHIVLAEFYLLHNEFEQALIIASRYLLKTPEQLEMTLVKTRALLSLKRVKEAKNTLHTIEKIASAHPEFIKNKALIHNIEGNNVEAINMIENFSAKSNGILNDDLWIMLGTLYIANMQIHEAENTLNKVKNKEHIKYLRIEGKMALMKGDNILAIKSLSKAFESTPSEIIALELAQALQNEGDFDKAIQLLENLLQKDDKGRLILVKYKLTELCEIKCPDKAESYHKKLLKETNSNVATLNNIAWFYYTQQRYTEGKKFASQAVQKSPNLAPTHNTLGVILLELDELAEGNRHLQISVTLEPNNDKYKVWLAKGLIQSGDSSSAEALRNDINFEALKPDIKVLFNKVFE